MVVDFADADSLSGVSADFEDLKRSKMPIY